MALARGIALRAIPSARRRGMLRALRLSGGSLLVGILQRFRWWAPAILLDPLDLYWRHINGLLPISTGMRLPSEYFGPVLIAGLLWAAFLTYHELDQQHRRLRAQLEDRQRRGAVRDTLGRMLAAGDTLFARGIAGDDDLARWTEDVQLWEGDALAYIRANLSEADATIFCNMAGLRPGAWDHTYDQAHDRRLARLDRLRQNLFAILHGV